MPKATSRANGARVRSLGKPNNRKVSRAKKKASSGWRAAIGAIKRKPGVPNGETLIRQLRDGTLSDPRKPSQVAVIKLIGLLRLVQVELELGASCCMTDEARALESCCTRIGSVMNDLAAGFIPQDFQDAINGGHRFADALYKEGEPIFDERINALARKMIVEAGKEVANG